MDLTQFRLPPLDSAKGSECLPLFSIPLFIYLFIYISIYFPVPSCCLVRDDVGETANKLEIHNTEKEKKTVLSSPADRNTHQ